MSDELKVLGQLEAAATTAETLYTVPNLAMTTISTLCVCNRTAGALTYRIAIRVAGASLVNKQYIAYDKQVAANSTDNWSIGIALNQDDVITVYASATGLSFTAFGVETS